MSYSRVIVNALNGLSETLGNGGDSILGNNKSTVADGIRTRDTETNCLHTGSDDTSPPGSINKLGSAIRDGGSNDRFHPDDLIVWLFRSQEEEEKEECKKTTKKDIFRTDRIWRKSYTRRMTWPWRTHGTDFLADSFSPLFVEPIYFIRYVHITKRKGEESLSSSVQLCSYGRGKNRKREKKGSTYDSFPLRIMRWRVKKIGMNIHLSIDQLLVGYGVVTRVGAKTIGE